MKSQPRCPEGHGPMSRIPTDRIEGKKAADWGVWWFCAEPGCDSTYVQPSLVMLLDASQPPREDPVCQKCGDLIIADSITEAVA